MARNPRPKVNAIFTSLPGKYEAGPGDIFEVGKIYQMSRDSLARWANLGRAREATAEEVATNPPVNAAPPLMQPAAVVETAPAQVAPIDAPAPAVSPPAEAPTTVVDHVVDTNKVMTPAELLAALDTDPAMKNFMTFRAEAAKILGDSLPQRKLDIVAALKALVPAA